MSNSLCWIPICSYTSPGKQGSTCFKRCSYWIYGGFVASIGLAELFESTLLSFGVSGTAIDGSVAKGAVRVGQSFKSSRDAKIQSLEAKASGGNHYPSTKPNSIVCAECDGNGAKKCTQCLGTGVNSVDHFNGQFKAGGLCWLCRGKRDILCGNCNGAGFIGGFMSTFDD